MAGSLREYADALPHASRARIPGFWHSWGSASRHPRLYAPTRSAGLKMGTLDCSWRTLVC
jgi:hypothetical protein